MKRQRFCLLLALTLSLTGCGLPPNNRVIIPDKRAGPNLVIYFAETNDTRRETRRIARAIARTTGGELFDLGGKTPFPDPLSYDTFFVGTALTEEGPVAAALIEFLEQTDFIDARVIPFWISREETGDLSGEFEEHLRGARFLPGGGFLLSGRVKAKDIETMAADWAEEALTQLGQRRAAGGDQAEDTVKLFAAAYTGRFGPVVFQDGDWTLEMDGVRWYYARGRFLSGEDKDRPEDFRPQFLYRYLAEPPAAPDELSLWQDRANRIISRRRSSASYGASSYAAPSSGAARSPFFAALWQARTRVEAFSHQRWITFLGWPVQVHQDITDPLARVEARIRELAADDPDIQGWIKNLSSVTGWNWRNIAGSEAISFHAYGAAIDLLLKSQTGKETYWQWTAAKGIDWRTVPAENRQTPPSPVIRTFEEQGFIWGGKWSRYDTMHFEYHPELLILGSLGSHR